jgi:hypothetical protein
MIVGDFNTPLSPEDRSNKKINKKTSELNDTIKQVNLTDIYGVFHTAVAQCTFFSAAHGIFSKTNHILGQ